MNKETITHQELWNNYHYGQRNTVYKLLRENDCSSVKVKGKWYVDINKFDKWYKKKIEDKKLKKEEKNANKSKKNNNSNKCI